MQNIRNNIRSLIERIQPIDELESVHRSEALAWIESGVEIFRIEKPDKPPMHLVSYCVVVDEEQQSVLLVDHIKAELWLPTGGHVEINEDPKDTAAREVTEELGIQPRPQSENPFFITISTTVGKTAGHRDVSLWYVFFAKETDVITFDRSEFYGYQWFTFDEVLEERSKKFDPHMQRFVKKLQGILGSRMGV